MIENQLREIDLQGETLGWGTQQSAAMLFVVWVDQAGQNHWLVPDPINDALATWACLYMHNVGLAITHMSEASEKLSALWAASGLPTHEEGLLGIGVRSECVRARGPQSLMDIMQSVAVGQNPSVEMRFTSFFGRDGSVCQLDHDRGALPTFLENRVEIGSGVEEAMSKLLSALVPEEVIFPWSHG